MRTHTYYFIIYDLYQNRLTFYFRSFDFYIYYFYLSSKNQICMYYNYIDKNRYQNGIQIYLHTHMYHFVINPCLTNKILVKT